MPTALVRERERVGGEGVYSVVCGEGTVERTITNLAPPYTQQTIEAVCYANCFGKREREGGGGGGGGGVTVLCVVRAL